MPTKQLTVDIACSVFDGARHLAALLRSLQEQTHRAWRLWVRDDGSTDASMDIVQAFARDDARIRLLPADETRLGAAQSFGWLLERIPAADYVMFADQDDVWLPAKIATSLKAMVRAERAAAGPVLVHTDLVVVDAELREIDRSFWHYARINPEARGLRRAIVRNTVTGATLLMNRALRARVGNIPAGAAMHDWWIGCVAAAFGMIVAVSMPTVLYRQHGTNTIGAVVPSSSLGWHDVPIAVTRALRNGGKLRSWIARAARQAETFLGRYGEDLTPEDRTFLAAYAQMPEQPYLRRKRDLFRMQLLAENGVVQNVGILMRA